MKNLDDVQRKLIRFLLDHLWEEIFFKGYLVAALDTSLMPIFGNLYFQTVNYFWSNM